jgi:hypothetical protein
MSLAGVASVVSIATGVNALTGGAITDALGMGPSQPSGAQAQQAADPFAPYRGDLAKQYSDAMKPGTVTDPTKMPGYSQWMSGVLEPAMEATQVRDAATGRGFSGQEKQDLMGVAQKGYYGFMTDYMNRLAQGSGAVNNPAPAAGMGLQQGQSNQQGFMQGVGGIMQGVQGLYNNMNMQSPDNSSPAWNSVDSPQQSDMAQFGKYGYTPPPADPSIGGP